MGAQGSKLALAQEATEVESALEQLSPLVSLIWNARLEWVSVRDLPGGDAVPYRMLLAVDSRLPFLGMKIVHAT